MDLILDTDHALVSVGEFESNHRGFDTRYTRDQQRASSNLNRTIVDLILFYYVTGFDFQKAFESNHRGFDTLPQTICLVRRRWI